MKDEGIQGTVYVQFVVGRDGKLEAFESLKAEDDRLIEPALKFMREMPDWEPGMKDDQPVKVRMVLPLKFSLD